MTLKTIGSKEVETSIEALKVELHLDLLVESLSYMPHSLPPIKGIYLLWIADERDRIQSLISGTH